MNKMKKISQAEKIISIILIFIVMTNVSGCAGYRKIPLSSLSDYTSHSHIVYGGKAKYILDNTVVSDGMLMGGIDSDRSGVKNAVRVYPSSYSSIRIDEMNTLTLPVEQIKTVEAPRIYIPKEVTYINSSKKPKKEKEPAGKTILRSLYYMAGFSVIGSLSWYIYEQKRH